MLLAWSGCSAKNKTTECVNPLTYTDIPDNDWIRVGNDYYMVSTTMYFCPGMCFVQKSIWIIDFCLATMHL